MEPLIKTRTDKKQFLEWMEALRSGKFKQTTRVLQNGNGYCCLGVACRILIPKNKLDENNGTLIGDLPIEQRFCPSWLKDINMDYKEKNRSGFEISYLNDKKSNTFKQIANKVERVYRKELDAVK